MAVSFTAGTNPGFEETMLSLGQKARKPEQIYKCPIEGQDSALTSTILSVVKKNV